MSNIKNSEQVELIRQSSLLVSKTLAELATVIKPGVTGLQIDKIAETFIRDNNAEPGFKGYRGFPYTLCVSVNDAVVHGFPTDIPFKEGDIVSVDCGVLMNEYYGDSAFTFAVGEISEEIEQLMKVTKKSLYLAIEQAVAGNRVGDIGYAVQNYCEGFGYGVVRELVGHGLGKGLHEDPEVPNYGKRGRGKKLKEGMVIAIEPMINMGTKNVITRKDGWTIATADKMPSVHFEHVVKVQKEEAEILTSFEIIEEAVKSNAEIKEIA